MGKITSHSDANSCRLFVGTTFLCILCPRLTPLSRIRSTTFSSRAYSSTRRLPAMMLAMADPKLPAPMTPMGLSDELFKVIAHQPVLIVVKQRQLLCDDIALLVPDQWPKDVEDPDIVETALDHDIGVTLYVRCMVDLALVFQAVNLFPDSSEYLLEFLVINFELVLGEPEETEQVELA